jgi:nitroimidazol reductase NimA-like FMN-containing flavoprotein (pyridoxamine 5'-phosphate oxidase superfamily)
MSSFGLEMLGIDECRELLAAHSFGRLAVWSGEHPAVFPVLYALLDGDPVVRTAPGEKLIAAALGQQVVLEIDAAEPARHTGWSVNVVGPAEEIVHPQELARAQALRLEPWAGDARDRFVRVRSRLVTGRRIRADHGGVLPGA